MARKPVMFSVDAFRVLTASQKSATMTLAVFADSLTQEAVAAYAEQAGPNPFMGTVYVTQEKGETLRATMERAYQEGAARYPGADLNVQRYTPSDILE